MGKFRLSFDMSNAAFDECPFGEAAAVLRAIAAKLESGHCGGPIRDVNGNRIGQWEAPEPEGPEE